MKIQELEKSWKIEPESEEEYLLLKKEIQALKYRMDSKGTSIGRSVWVEIHELEFLQLQAGWPPAQPPSHGCGWPQEIEQHPISRDQEDDFENF